jgi:hypothetical protein
MPGEPLPDVSSLSPFKAVVVIATDYTQEWQDQVSTWLVESGCRYMMAWGPDCSSWDDSVDHADITRYFPNEIPANEFVMTTWHENQTLEEVFWEAQFVAEQSYDGIKLVNALIIHIADSDREEWIKTLFERSKTLAGREPG